MEQRDEQRQTREDILEELEFDMHAHTYTRMNSKISLDPFASQVSLGVCI